VTDAVPAPRPAASAATATSTCQALEASWISSRSARRQEQSREAELSSASDARADCCCASAASGSQLPSILFENFVWDWRVLRSEKGTAALSSSSRTEPEPDRLLSALLPPRFLSVTAVSSQWMVMAWPSLSRWWRA
jgi:hypothetical protein